MSGLPSRGASAHVMGSDMRARPEKTVRKNVAHGWDDLGGRLILTKGRYVGTGAYLGSTY